MSTLTPLLLSPKSDRLSQSVGGCRIQVDVVKFRAVDDLNPQQRNPSVVNYVPHFDHFSAGSTELVHESVVFHALRGNFDALDDAYIAARVRNFDTFGGETAKNF